MQFRRGLKCMFAVFATHPRQGNNTGRLWQGCHNSGVPPLVELTYIPGLRRKSVDGREQVSLSAVLSSRLICHDRVRGLRWSLETAFRSPPKAVFPGVAPRVAITRFLCLHCCIFNFQASDKGVRKYPFTYRRFQGPFVGFFEKKDKTFFLAAWILSEILE